jgi:hypothetical protein
MWPHKEVSGVDNTGNYNKGDYNTGIFNSCDFSSGVFCTTEEKIRLFNQKSEMTAGEFYNSKYYMALSSVPFYLTEVKDNCSSNRFKNACANWWNNMSEENRKIIMSMPNFDKDIFFEITGIKV